MKMGAEQVPAYLFGHFSDEVSKSTLAEMLSLVGSDREIVLLGFSDYTKHIINNFGENVTAVFEIDPRFVGFEFRGHQIQHIDSLVSSQIVDDFIVCVFDHLVDYTGAIQSAGLADKPILWPEDFDGKKGHRYHIREQSPLYRYEHRPDRLGEPPTMMPRETITFLTELLRATLRVEGDVAEVGVWQGGSAWNMAKMMQVVGNIRQLHLFDFFDDHARTNPEAIMCLDEIRARFSFYDQVHFYRGFAEQHMDKLADRDFCFVHVDLGFIPTVLDFFWSRLKAGGIMALDNYGHIRSWPTEFDRFFAERAHSIIRMPFSYQAFVVK
jgi:predicted O-methyltransferase YrrM